MLHTLSKYSGGMLYGVGALRPGALLLRCGDRVVGPQPIIYLISKGLFCTAAGLSRAKAICRACGILHNQSIAYQGRI